MGVILDTSTLIAVERGQVPWDAIGLPSEELALSVVTVAELLHGVSRADTEARRLRRSSFVETLLASMPVWPFDMSIARIYADLWADLAEREKMVGTHEMMIGATALALGYRVSTINVRDYARIPSLQVVQLKIC